MGVEVKVCRCHKCLELSEKLLLCGAAAAAGAA